MGISRDGRGTESERERKRDEYLEHARSIESIRPSDTTLFINHKNRITVIKISARLIRVWAIRDILVCEVGLYRYCMLLFVYTLTASDRRYNIVASH